MPGIINEMLVIIILMFFLLGSWVLQMIYLLYFYGRLAWHKQSRFNHRDFPVSVIICAKDEYYNLEENLPSILEQDYSEFEVLVVNDASEDDTSELLEDMQRKYPHLKVVNINSNLNFFKGKKFPLSLGIKSAKYEHLLLTDADCKPSSLIWIRKMMSAFTEGKEIVIGYSPFRKTRSFLNSILRFDSFYIGMQYLSFALSGNAYMAVGRNLAYKKSLFMANKGFQSHYKIPSGDDDLFINQVATKTNVAVQYDADAQTITKAVSSYSELIRQKRRHLRTGGHYNRINKFLLGINISSLVVFYTLLVLILSLSSYYIFPLALLFLRIVIQLLIFKKCMDKLNVKDLLLISPLIELFLLFFNILLSFSNIFVRQHKWK